MNAAGGHFTRNGEPGNWGTNLSRALWYTSRGSNGTAREGRLTVREFLEILNRERPGVAGSRSGWMQDDWEVTLPNGVKLGFMKG